MGGFPPKLTKVLRPMSVSRTTIERIDQLLQSIQKEWKKEDISWPELREQVEKLLIEINIGEFLENRHQANEQFLERLEDRLRELPPDEKQRNVEPQGVQKEPESEADQPKQQERSMSLGDEVKVLPDPEGPPVHKKTVDLEAYNSLAEEIKPSEKKVLNESAPANEWKLGLNDRIALTQHLFEGSNADMQRVFSQIETMANFAEAKRFLMEMVKPDYDWSGSEEYVERLLELTEAYFQMKPAR